MGLTAARHSIESWQTELSGFEGAGFKTIVTDLGHLHDELSKDEISGERVGKLLAKLGQATAKHAKDAGEKGNEVAELGKLLEHGASELSGAKA